MNVGVAHWLSLVAVIALVCFSWGFGYGLLVFAALMWLETLAIIITVMQENARTDRANQIEANRQRRMEMIVAAQALEQDEESR